MSLSSIPKPLIKGSAYSGHDDLTPFLNAETIGGYFFTYDPVKTEVVYTVDCRDVISGMWDRQHGCDSTPKQAKDVCPFLGFARKKIVDLADFAARWDEIETMLGLTDKSIIHPTTIEGAFLIELCPFWLANDTRRSLVTLFIRAFAAYPRPTLKATLEAYPLSRTIIPVINHFLRGHTQPTYEKMSKRFGFSSHIGVVTEFHNLSAQEIASMLVKPSV